MRHFAVISFVERSVVNDRTIEQFEAMFPNQKSRLTLDTALIALDDPRLDEVIALVEGEGLVRWHFNSKFDRNSHYRFTFVRKYDPSDFEGLELYQLQPTDTMIGGYSLDHRMSVIPEGIDRQASFLRITYGEYAVPDRVRRLMEGHGLRGVSFREIALVRDQKNKTRELDWVQTVGERYWQLWSEVVMPPLSEAVQLYDRDYRDLEGPDRLDFSNGCHLREGCWRPPEMHYTRASLEAMPEWPEFDLAVTYEPFGVNASNDWRELIASRRFYEFCREHGLQSDWLPVRIDENTTPQTL